MSARCDLAAKAPPDRRLPIITTRVSRHYQRLLLKLLKFLLPPFLKLLTLSVMPFAHFPLGRPRHLVEVRQVPVRLGRASIFRLQVLFLLGQHGLLAGSLLLLPVQQRGQVFFPCLQ
jgi:hypothetical protein